jgi:hypothetical protein
MIYPNRSAAKRMAGVMFGLSSCLLLGFLSLMIFRGSEDEGLFATCIAGAALSWFFLALFGVSYRLYQYAACVGPFLVFRQDGIVLRSFPRSQIPWTQIKTVQWTSHYGADFFEIILRKTNPILLGCNLIGLSPLKFGLHYLDCDIQEISEFVTKKLGHR